MRVFSCLTIAAVWLALCGHALDARAQVPRDGAEERPDEMPNSHDPPLPQVGQPDAAASIGNKSQVHESVCLIIESAARANGLPLEFFARVIWQESRFQADAVGPLTRRGTRAQGIAQFMPGTAAERRLLDPFDPVQALPKSAEFLRELANAFGNLGLAAAAYNAGPQRVRDWLAGQRTLPNETRNYVSAVTGVPVDHWAATKADAPYRPPPQPSCRNLIALLKRAPNPFVEQLEHRITLVAASPWGIELSAGFSRERVLAAYARVSKQHGGVLAGRDPSILSTTLRSRGTRPFYRVRVGAETRESANGLCAKIRSAGGACIVLRNPRAAG